MEKQNINNDLVDQTNIKNDDNFFDNEINSNEINELKLITKKLNFLCQNFDPFSPEQVSSEVQNLLKEFNLQNSLENPFEFTNKVLQLLDETEQKINKKIQ